MSWDIPTLAELKERMTADYELRYQRAGISVDARTRGTGHTEKVNAIAGVIYGLHLQQQWVAEQQFIDTMSDENVVRTGSELGLSRIAPSFATGQLRITRTGGTGPLTLPSGTVFNAPNGTQFRTRFNVLMTVVGSANVDVVSLETGESENVEFDNSSVFVMDSVLPDFDANATMVGAIENGRDIEPMTRFKARVKERRKQPPLGGAYHDYVSWAKAASTAVYDVWVSAHESNVGEIIVRFVTDNISAPLPNAALVQTVEDYINQVKPVEANLVVQAPTLRPLNLTFTALSPNTSAMQAAVDAEVEDLLQRGTRSDSTMYINSIRAAISNTPGIEDFTLSQDANIAIAIDEYVVLGTTTFP